MRKSYLVIIAFCTFSFAASAQNEIISINTDKVDNISRKQIRFLFLSIKNILMKEFGRIIFLKLLEFNCGNKILQHLKITEAELKKSG